jgi:hypothetical protein
MRARTKNCPRGGATGDFSGSLFPSLSLSLFLSLSSYASFSLSTFFLCTYLFGYWSMREGLPLPLPITLLISHYHDVTWSWRARLARGSDR